MRADFWFKLSVVQPEVAAMVLCGFNPNEMEFAKAAALQVPELPDRALVELSQYFCSKKEKDQANRSLREWLQLVLDQELSVHPYAQRYVELGKVREVNPTTRDTREGVPTPAIAAAFDGIKWKEQAWRKQLGNPPQWLVSARMSKGLRGKRKKGATMPSTWNPLLIGVALTQKGANRRRIRNVFETSPDLKSWRDEWNETEATYYDNDD